MNKTGILLLAAGGSRRMGRPKQLLEVGGKRLIQVVVERLLALPDCEVAVVLGAYRSDILPFISHFPIHILENPLWEEGMGSSLRLGVRHFSARPIDRLLIALADQALLETRHFSSLLSAADTHPPQITAANYSQRPGAPIIFPRAFFPQLETARGDTGARHWVRDRDDLHLVDLPLAAQDWDCPEDLPEGVA